ncbi:phosphoribosyltransferase [Actinocrinis puniceicyclus]|uniref:Phosphoribosyltransferase n=1 Tax=Actinocrinis puniceicyclus TaxID=977794 RepID=A0A8J8BB34_9ACTN|nr:phosphoribosyltransferase [Actinocrinis puniceicyclus]MBS2963607.1 phosphoribosyltransferase [Actinocrinis puniceicyclus]
MYQEPEPRFADRVDAGRSLAVRLEHLRGQRPVILGLPRGGVPVAYEVAHALGAPLDVIVVRKLGVPWQPELAMGAIGEGGARVVDAEVLRLERIGEDLLAQVEEREAAELLRRAQAYRVGREPEPIAGRTVVVVDDGIATGSTARAACQVVRQRGAARVVLAAPVLPLELVGALGEVADEVVWLCAPEPMFAVGYWYEDFDQLTDTEVVELLARARTPS